MGYKMNGSPHKLGVIEGTSAYKSALKAKPTTSTKYDNPDLKALTKDLNLLQTQHDNAKTEEERTNISSDITHTVKLIQNIDPDFGGTI